MFPEMWLSGVQNTIQNGPVENLLKHNIHLEKDIWRQSDLILIHPRIIRPEPSCSQIEQIQTEREPSLNSAYPHKKKVS